MSWNGAFMAALAMVSVGLWTLRVALAASGRRLTGAAVAAVEAVVFALAFSNLVTDLGSWERVAGYAVGVAVGTVGGLAVNDRFSNRAAIVEVVVAGDGAELREAFRTQGWPVTTMAVTGVSGLATMLLLVVHAQRADQVVSLVDAVAPRALWTIRQAVAARGIPGMATSVSI